LSQELSLYESIFTGKELLDSVLRSIIQRFLIKRMRRALLFTSLIIQLINKNLDTEDPEAINSDLKDKGNLFTLSKF